MQNLLLTNRWIAIKLRPMSGIKFHPLIKIIAQELLTPMGDFSIQAK
jgi:hypothetical protein